VGLFLFDYVKEQVYSQRVKTPDELKAWITATSANIINVMLQHVWQRKDNTWDVGRATDGAHCDVFCI
jgi:hypothetical protein